MQSMFRSMTVCLALCVAGAAFAEEPKKPGKTWCGFFTHGGAKRVSYCIALPPAEAKVDCEKSGKQRFQMDVICECRNDPDFVSTRCDEK